MLLRLSSVLEGLRRIDWVRLGVRWVVLFGSLAGRGAGEDVDLLVRPVGRGGGEWRLRLAVEVGDVLGVDWARVDVVEADSGTPCPVVYDAWRRGVVVYEERRGAARDWLLARVAVCNDYRIAAEKLGVFEAAVEAVRRRWARGGSR